MTEHHSTTGSKAVEVELISYNAERGFGFAIDYNNCNEDRIPAKIFFHRSACRKVDGTPKKPVLSDQRTSHTFDPSVPHQRMLMQYHKGERGFRATAWGIPPKRTATSDLIEDGGVERFVGGHATLMNLRQKHEFISGTVQGAKLARGCLELDLSDAYANGNRLNYTLYVEINLYEGWGSPNGGTGYSLETWIGTRRATATFCLPQQGS
jgi:hypothetical protein